MRVRDPSELRRWRRLRNLSQRDLAYLCRCSQAAISLLERGGMSSLSDELALSISSRLQVSWEELFDHGPEGQEGGSTTDADPASAGSTTGISPTDDSDVSTASAPTRR